MDKNLQILNNIEAFQTRKEMLKKEVAQNQKQIASLVEVKKSRKKKSHFFGFGKVFSIIATGVVMGLGLTVLSPVSAIALALVTIGGIVATSYAKAYQDGEIDALQKKQQSFGQKISDLQKEILCLDKQIEDNRRKMRVTEQKQEKPMVFGTAKNSLNNKNSSNVASQPDLQK